MSSSLFSNYEVLCIKSKHNYQKGEVYDNTNINLRFDLFHGLIIENLDYQNGYQRLHFKYQDWLERKQGKEFELPKHND